MTEKPYQQPERSGGPAHAPDPFIEASKSTLLRRMRKEYRDGFRLPVVCDLQTLIALVGNLQLALRHPDNTGLSREIVRGTIDQIIQRVQDEGFRAHAEAMRLGDDPTYDTPPGGRP